MTDHDVRLREFYDAEMSQRAVKPLGAAREQAVSDFRELLDREECASVLEVGCGAGRDGLRLSQSGIAYTGVDPSSAAVRICREHGLSAVRASAVELPFENDSFDSAWSMSTLMHLPGEGLTQALSELRRVLRRGAPVAVGVWGGTETREWIAPDGRFFLLRSDAELKQALEEVGRIEAYETWEPGEHGGHYQWARIRT